MLLGIFKDYLHPLEVSNMTLDLSQKQLLGNDLCFWSDIDLWSKWFKYDHFLVSLCHHFVSVNSAPFILFLTNLSPLKPNFTEISLVSLDGSFQNFHCFVWIGNQNHKSLFNYSKMNWKLFLRNYKHALDVHHYNWYAVWKKYQ